MPFGEKLFLEGERIPPASQKIDAWNKHCWLAAFQVYALLYVTVDCVFSINTSLDSVA